MKSTSAAFVLIFLCYATTGFSEKIYSVVTAQLGGPDYVPVAGDFDGDGKIDPAVYQEASGNWFTALSSNNYALVTARLGGPGWTAVEGDFDGDGRSDPAVYQAAGGGWYVSLSGSGYATVSTTGFGAPGYLPVPGDYDGQGESELALYQQSSGNWVLLRGEDAEVTDTNVLARMYAAAMVNSSNVIPSKIRRDLTPVSESNNGLYWRTNPDTGAREVLVASFMKKSFATNYYRVGQYTPMRYVEAWDTLSPELKNFCRGFTGTDLLLRMKQVLGLPATAGNDYVVEYYVEPRFLLRPSRDPEITDNEAETAFRADTAWLGAVSTNYTAWFQATIASRNYGMTNGVWNAWPWTQLGYTYDWFKSGNNVMGLSEYVVPGPLLYSMGYTSVNVYVVTVVDALSYANTAAPQAVFAPGAPLGIPARQHD